MEVTHAEKLNFRMSLCKLFLCAWTSSCEFAQLWALSEPPPFWSAHKEGLRLKETAQKYLHTEKVCTQRTQTDLHSDNPHRNKLWQGGPRLEEICTDGPR